jgi:hypothetical protein
MCFVLVLLWFFPLYFNFFSIEMSHDSFCCVSLLFPFLWLLTTAGLQLYYLVYSFIFVYFFVLLTVALVPLLLFIYLFIFYFSFYQP